MLNAGLVVEAVAAAQPVHPAEAPVGKVVDLQEKTESA
jgi:hypothetical protein